jgi:hypothetical protein
MNFLRSTCIIGVVSAVAVAIMLLARRRAPDGSWFNDGDRAAGVFGVLATGFSVLLGFVVFLAFTSYDTARSGAEKEAMDVLQQYQTAQFFPAASAPTLSGELVCYGRAVVHREWPQLQDGNAPPFNPWSVPLFQELKTVTPVSQAEQAAYSKWLDQTTDRQEARLDRVRGEQGVIPTPMWFILLLSAGFVIVYTFFFADSGESKVVQGLLAGTVAAMLTASLLVIRFLDHPYHPGSGSLQPTAMLRVLGQMQVLTDQLQFRVRMPCDAAGRARPTAVTGD